MDRISSKHIVGTHVGNEYQRIAEEQNAKEKEARRKAKAEEIRKKDAQRARVRQSASARPKSVA